jgi:hypothetical protein
MVIATPEYLKWSQVPPQHNTKKQWLKLHRRLKKGAEAVGTITLIFDKPRSRPKGVDPVCPEDCHRIRRKLDLFGTDPSDQWDFYRLDRAGQLAIVNLYDAADTEEITCFTKVEARTLLEYMLWDHSHEDHYITEATGDAGRQRATWKSEFSVPNLAAHLEGVRYFGAKKGRMTMQVTVDGDRHSGKVPGEEHIAKMLGVGEVLKSDFPEYRFAPEINPRNGSVKFFGWLPDFTAMPRAEKLAEEVRTVLQEKLPGYDFSGLEIFPSSSPQVFAPLRADKTMVVGDGVLRKVKAWRMERDDGKRKRRYYDAYSCADYLNWVYFSDTPFNSEAFERELRAAVARCPDVEPGGAPPPERRRARPKKSGGNGMGSIGRLKGRCATAMVKFWSELEVPEDDTIGKYLIVTARVLRYEGLGRDEGLEWIEGRLEALKNTAFSDRLSYDPSELRRVTAYALDAVWDRNGYQRDPDLSDRKLRASVDAWAKHGFRLHDPATWHNHVRASGPLYKLVWTGALLQLVPGLAAIAHTDHDRAKEFLETVLSFVQGHNELAESVVGKLLVQCGIRGRSRQKQHDVRKFLVERGLLIRQKNYFCDQATGYRHGNFYICGPGVAFEEEARHDTPTHPVSIYLSLNIVSDDDETDAGLGIIMERRRLTCERRYQERLRLLRQGLRRAA